MARADNDVCPAVTRNVTHADTDAATGVGAERLDFTDQRVVGPGALHIEYPHRSRHARARTDDDLAFAVGHGIQRGFAIGFAPKRRRQAGEGAEVADRDIGQEEMRGRDPAGDPRGRRAIEVKGRAGTGDVEVSSNEWARAANLRDGPVGDGDSPCPRVS